MTQRHPANQLDLFVPSAKAEANYITPRAGLAVQLPSPCRCGAGSAEIELGRGPHLAGLRCIACGKHRGWMSREAHRFIVEVVKKFGRPSSPIVIRTNTNPQPSPNGDAN
jgi:hypothetical protein